MKIAIASDHKGYHLKTTLITYLNKRGYEVIDLGTDSVISTDYPKYAFRLCEKVINKEAELGIVICGTGIGISIACNKVKGIRCGKVNTEEEAIHGRECDFINIIALSGVTPLEENKKIIDAFLNAHENTTDPAYKKRVDQIMEYEND